MNYLTLSQELDGIADVRVIGKPQYVVVCCTCFLLSRQVLCKVGDYVALGLEIGCRKRRSRSCYRVYSGGVIHEICVKSASLDLVYAQIPRQLVEDRGNYFYVGELIRTSMIYVKILMR